MNFVKKISLLFLLVISVAYGQNKRVISGVVTAASDKQPLPGASVFIPSKTISNQSVMDGFVESIGIGVVTDFDGKFSLSVPSDTQQIAVSFVGFQTKIIRLSSKDFYQISLQDEAQNLEEVILTGYQKIEKRKLTSAVVKVNTEDIKQVGVASIDQLLQGQIAGMVTSVESGSPGEIAKIRIRGTASLSGTQDPLWVLDGLPLEGNEVPNLLKSQNIDELRSYSIAGINPDDIQDITILKDAAATAIYGARAANGVIVITTKRGKKGDMKVNISANTFVTQRPDFSKLNLMSAAEKVDFELYLASRSDLDYRKNRGEVSRILTQNNEFGVFQKDGFSALSPETQSAINSLKNSENQWYKLLYRNAYNKQYSASISGGSDLADYYLSLGYYDEEGATIGTGFERYNVSFTNTYRLNDRLKLGASVLASHTHRKSYLTDSAAIINPSKYSRVANPYFTPFDAQGNYLYDKDVIDGANNVFDFNPLEERENTKYSLKAKSVKAVLDLEYKLPFNFTFASQLGIQYDDDSTEKYASENSYFYRSFKEKTRYFRKGEKKYFLPQGGIIQNWESHFFQYNWKNTLQFNSYFADNHEVDLLLGSEIRRNKLERIHTKGFGYDAQTLKSQPIIFPDESTEATSSSFIQYVRNEDENAYASFYATASYTYKQRYTLFSSVRYDGSNLFGVAPEYRYLPLWAVSGSWLVSQEDFLNGSEFLPYLRLRASYGLQGNIDRNTSPFVIGEYNTHSFLPNSTHRVLRVVSPPNDKLRWEKTTNYNAGFDAGFFNNRIRVSGDFYQRISSDLIGTRSLPLENGFSSKTINWAQVSNKGYELTLSTTNIKTADFQWNTNISFAHNQSKVDKIQIDENELTPSLEGLPVNAVFAFRSGGYSQNGLPMLKDKNGNLISLAKAFELFDPYADFFPGEVASTNLNRSQIRDLYQFVGDRDPKFSGGIVNTFRYKNFDLVVSANFNIKQMMVRSLPYNPTQVDRGENQTTDILNVWTTENTNTIYPRIMSKDNFTETEDLLAYNWIAGRTNGFNINTLQSLDTWVKDMSFLRISSIRLGYSLPENVVKKMGIGSLKFNIEGRNLFVFSTDYSGYFDPETYGNIYAQPISRSLTFGLNLTF